MKNPNALAIESIRKRIQVVAFEANLYDLGISNNVPYHEACSKLRKKLNKEIVRLGGGVKPLPFQKVDHGQPADFRSEKKMPKPKMKSVKQLDLFG